MKRRLRVAAAQFAPVRGNIAENIHHHVLLIKTAAAAESDIILFPELSLTGYEPELASSLALNENDARLMPLQALAEQHNMTIIIGAPLKVADNKPAIAAFILSSQRPIRVYRKMHLHPGESNYFAAGSRECVFAGQHFNIGLAICADAGQPTHPENTVHLGAEIYLNAVLSADGYDKDAGLLKTYAARHSIPILMANYSGPSGGWQPVGKSAAWNARGECIAQAPEKHAALVILEMYDGHCSGEVIFC